MASRYSHGIKMTKSNTDSFHDSWNHDVRPKCITMLLSDAWYIIVY